MVSEREAGPDDQALRVLPRGERERSGLQHGAGLLLQAAWPSAYDTHIL